MKVGTEQEWQAARKEMLAAERELEEHAKRVETQRRELPWVPVEKEYRFATEDGPKSLAELFEGRSQLLIYQLMFGEDWAVACPGCSSLVDGLGGVERIRDTGRGGLQHVPRVSAFAPRHAAVLRAARAAAKQGVSRAQSSALASRSRPHGLNGDGGAAILHLQEWPGEGRALFRS